MSASSNILLAWLQCVSVFTKMHAAWTRDWRLILAAGVGNLVFVPAALHQQKVECAQSGLEMKKKNLRSFFSHVKCKQQAKQCYKKQNLYMLPALGIGFRIAVWDRALRESPAFAPLEEQGHNPDSARTMPRLLRRCLYLSELTGKASRSSIRRQHFCNSHQIRRT